MDTNKMREQFEAWAEKATLQIDLSRGNHGSYRNTNTHWLYCAWVCAWSASREAVSVDLPTLQCLRVNQYDYQEARQQCVEAIEAQGLKVAP